MRSRRTSALALVLFLAVPAVAAAAVAVGVVDHVHQHRGAAIKRAALKPQMHFEIGAEMEVIIAHVPIEDEIAAAHERQRLALGKRGREGAGDVDDGNGLGHSGLLQPARIRSAAFSAIITVGMWG